MRSLIVKKHFFSVSKLWHNHLLICHSVCERELVLWNSQVCSSGRTGSNSVSFANMRRYSRAISWRPRIIKNVTAYPQALENTIIFFNKIITFSENVNKCSHLNSLSNCSRQRESNSSSQSNCSFHSSDTVAPVAEHTRFYAICQCGCWIKKTLISKTFSLFSNENFWNCF